MDICVEQIDPSDYELHKMLKRSGINPAEFDGRLQRRAATFCPGSVQPSLVADIEQISTRGKKRKGK